MSVNKSDRTDKSELCYLAEQAEYKIIKMTMNEKYFPKRARFIITNQIIDSVMSMANNMNIANSIFPNTEEKVKIREQYQYIGRGNLNSLESQLNLANKLFNIPSGVLDEIFVILKEIKSRYSNWVKSGRKVLNRELKKLKNKLDRGEIEFADIRQSYASWKGSLKGKKCYKTIQSMDELFNKLFINDWRLNYEY